MESALTPREIQARGFASGESLTRVAELAGRPSRHRRLRRPGAGRT